MCASHWASNPKGVAKAKACSASLGEIRCWSNAAVAHPRGVCEGARFAGLWAGAPRAHMLGPERW